jgi:beta-exotoxin I transport system ATP-binding protein
MSGDDAGMSDVPAAIVIDHLTKSYGTSRGVEDLSLQVRHGEVFGYLGPNGAGKTTTIRTMLDLIRPTSGSIRVFGLDSATDAPAIHTRVGYVPGEFGLYERLTGRGYLRTFAALRGGAGGERIASLAGRLDLNLDVRIRALSHGNRRKLALIQAFMHDPDLLVLDEPTQGLDPLMQQEFHAMIDEVRRRGGTVFLSSHVLPEVERMCDRVGIIRDGRLIAVDDVGDLKAKAMRSVAIHFAEPVGPEAFSHLASVLRVEAHGDVIEITVRGHLDEVVKEAARHTVITIESHEPSLEDVFLQTYRDGRMEGDAT